MTCSKLSGCNETGFAFGIAYPPMASSFVHSPLGTSSEHASAAACSAFCYDGRKDIGVLPIVMTERKFRQVQREIVFRDIVERTNHTAFQQAPESLDIIGMHVASDILFPGMMHRVVGTSRKCFIDIRIARSFIGGDKGNVLIHGLLHKVLQRMLIGQFDHLADDIAFAGDGPNDGHFGAAACRMVFLTPMPVLILAADVSFIHFYLTHQLGKASILHRGADAMAHIPSRAVVAASDLAMDLQGADPLLALGHQVNDLEPSPKRIVGILEHGAGNDREAIAVPSATSRIFTDPVKWASLQGIDFRALTARALCAIWPALSLQELLAGFFGGEARHQCRQGHRGFHRVPSLCWMGVYTNLW